MSKIAWLDYDGAAREKALQLLSAFQEKEVIIRMEVNVKVIDNVMKEIPHIIYRSNMKVLCVFGHHI